MFGLVSQFSLACHLATFLIKCVMLQNGGQVTKAKEKWDINSNIQCYASMVKL